MKFKTLLFLCLLSVVGFAQNSSLKHHNVKTVELFKVQGYLEHLPPDYYSNPTKKYPLLIFLHGAGERGNTPADLYKVAKNGPPKEIENQGSLCFEVNGKEECFIVLSPQLTGNGNWTGYVQREFWNYILNGPNNYRYDPNRIYLTGLSLGGNGVYERAYDDDNSANNLAAIAPLCAWANNSKACTIADRNIPVWAFHGTSDDVIGFNAGLSMFNAVNECPTNTQVNKFTAIEGGEHWIWNDVYKTDHSQYNQNVYEWLLSHSLDDQSTQNLPPVVDAGQDISKPIGIDTLQLSAQATDPEGSNLSYQWEKVSGNELHLSNITSSNLIIETPQVGSYELKITVTDDQGAKATDQVVLNILDSVNQAPTVNAGEDINTTIDEDAIYLTAEASDTDGQIISYNWRKISGPESVRLWNPDRNKLTLVKFTAGTYELEIQVEDDKGATATDQVTVTVTDTNLPPPDTTQVDSISNTQPVASLEEKVSSDGMPYLEYLPSDYSEANKYPLIVYLHSKSAEGTNLDLIKNEGPLYFAAQEMNICANNGECFIVLSPQIKKGSGFWKGKIDRFYNYILQSYSVDPERIFLTGFDEGAQDGMVRLTDDTNLPNRWAAFAGVSYSMRNSDACDIAASGASFYLANSTMDDANNYSNAEEFFNQLDNCTSNTTRFTNPSGNQIESNKNFFNPETSDLYDWLLSHGKNGNSNARTSNNTSSTFSQAQGESKTHSEKNYLVGNNALRLIETNQSVQINVRSLLGVTVKSIISTGEINFTDLQNGIYIYYIQDQEGRVIQKGRIIKQ